MKKITDKKQIENLLRACMLNPKDKPFVSALFTREHRAGGTIYEGVRPFAISSMFSDVFFQLTSSDSNYSRVIVTVRLSEIEYVQI